jgi:hypothetical protein
MTKNKPVTSTKTQLLEQAETNLSHMEVITLKMSATSAYEILLTIKELLQKKTKHNFRTDKIHENLQDALTKIQFIKEFFEHAEQTTGKILQTPDKNLPAEVKRLQYEVERLRHEAGAMPPKSEFRLTPALGGIIPTLKLYNPTLKTHNQDLLHKILRKTPAKP